MRGTPNELGWPFNEYADVVNCLRALNHVGFFLAHPRIQLEPENSVFRERRVHQAWKFCPFH
jgi:hypothetical protein